MAMHQETNDEASFDSGYAIIWLDANIGPQNNHRMMKKEFQAGLVEVAAVPPAPHDPLDDLLCAVREYSAPIEFVITPEKAIELIRERSNLYKIILISSASLGQKVVPMIQEHQLNVKSYYIFCANIDGNQDWFLQCVENGLDMQIFNHQISLLIRLCRDMSKILTNDGIDCMNAQKPTSALRYFEYALALADKAVMYDRPIDDSDSYRPSTDHQRKLQALMEKARQQS